jgi:hypothetical protein
MSEKKCSTVSKVQNNPSSEIKVNKKAENIMLSPPNLVVIA